MFPWLMFPWFWTFRRVEYPLSGNVNQDILTGNDLFFNSIPSEAGNGIVEQKIFNSVSYGKQLKLVIKTLLTLYDEELIDKEKAEKSFKELKELEDKIERAKREAYEKTADHLIGQMELLRKKNREQFNKVFEHFGIKAEP